MKSDLRQSCPSTQPSRLLIGLTQSLIVALFIFAGISKIVSPENAGYVVQLIIPVFPIKLSGVLLGTLEVLSGLLIIFKSTRSAGLAVIGAMIFGFIFINIYFEILGLKISCGCFGASDSNQLGIKSLPYIGSLGLLVLFIIPKQDQISSPNRLSLIIKHINATLFPPRQRAILVVLASIGYVTGVSIARIIPQQSHYPTSQMIGQTLSKEVFALDKFISNPVDINQGNPITLVLFRTLCYECRTHRIRWKEQLESRENKRLIIFLTTSDPSDAIAFLREVGIHEVPILNIDDGFFYYLEIQKVPAYISLNQDLTIQDITYSDVNLSTWPN